MFIYNSNCEKEVILLMIPNGGKWNYLAVKKLKQKIKLELHKIVCENKDFCNIIMPSEDTKILEFNKYQKSDKAPFFIYVALECLIEKIDGCKNNSENSFTTKVGESI